jgi:hypothetical protein
MKPRDLFGLAVRVLGLWFLTQNLYWFLWAAVKAHDSSFGNPNITPHEDVGYGIIYLILGALLMTCADPIVWAVYGLPPKATPSDTAGGSSADAKPVDAPPP